MLFDAPALAGCFGIAENDNVRSTTKGLALRGAGAGLHRPERLTQYLAQLAHESARFRYDRELWGPTPAQQRYEGRADLGNTQPGDGLRFRGRGPIQNTGRDNYGNFTEWARQIDPAAPDFVENPDAVNTDPWEGLVAIWYWETRDLNRYADQGDIEMVTRQINGGLNGFGDRLSCYDTAALWFLAYPSVYAFQSAVDSLTVDGISGPKTRAALHIELRRLPDVQFSKAGGVVVPTPLRLDPISEESGGLWTAIIRALLALFGGKK